MENIEKEFKNRGIRQGKKPYYYVFSAENALALIEKCHEINRIIYGIDVFRTKEANEIVDYIDYSAKYYELFNPIEYLRKFHIEKNKDSGHWEEAKQFIKDRMNSGYYFEIVYETPKSQS